METLAIGIRNAGTLAHSFSTPSLIWTNCLLRLISGKETGWIWGWVVLGLPMGAFAKIVCASSGGMTPKYNTRRAFVFLLRFLSFGSEGRRETGYNSIPITLLGTVPIFFFFLR